MKKIAFITIALVALAMSVSCKKEPEHSSPVLKITATSEVEKTVGKVMVLNGSDTLAILDCGAGIKLSSDGGTPFNIAVKEGTYAELRVTFETVPDVITETATKAWDGEVTLAAGDLLEWPINFSEDDWTPSCVAAGTMITMANGERKAVEYVSVGDMVRTFDHEKGEISSAPVCFVWESRNVTKAFTLTFEGGTEVTVVEEHGFYDRENKKYSFINANNAKDCIGHHFYDADNGRWLELTGCKLLNKGVDAYAIITGGHLDHLANGMLSMCDGPVKILANLFEYDDNMRIDAGRKASDIEAFGLTPLEKITAYKGFVESNYNDYNLMYLDIAVGKGLTSWDYIQALSDYCEEFLNQ